MDGLKGKVAIVTGAGKGIGRATAVELAKAGARVVLAGVRESSMADVLREVEEAKADALVVQTDVSKWEDAQRMAKKALERFGRIDILVNNAGIHPLGKGGERINTLEIDDSGWDMVVNTNLKGQFNCGKAVMPTMISQKYGRIVNLGSNTALTGIIGSAVYCASKAGIMALTKVWARELGLYNITVNCVAPGLTLTPMNEPLPPDVLEAAKARISLGRAGLAVDIARTILCFVRDEVWATGQTLVADGGSYMH